MSLARGVTRVAIAAVTLALQGACVAIRPPDNVGFGRAPTLRDLDGIYRNEGEGEAG